MRLLKNKSALFSVKVCRKQWGLSICWPDQSTTLVHHRWQSRARTKDRRFNGRPTFLWTWCIRQEWFVPFNEYLFSIYRHKLSMTMNHPMLFLIILRPTTTPHPVCSLLRTVSQDTPVIKPKLFTLSHHNHLLWNFIPNNAQQCLVKRWYRARVHNDLIPVETIPILSN